jgi:hypothetical protein
MKSKITIEIDWDNQPIICINYFHSEDVRDSLVKRFLETFGGDSCIAHFSFFNAINTEYVNSRATIRPMSPKDLARDSGFYKGQIENAIERFPGAVVCPQPISGTYAHPDKVAENI